jgi:putative ABC transport system permease protein
MGATRANLRTQFIVESGLICLSSLLLVVGIYVGLEKFLQSVTNGHLLPLTGDPTFTNIIFVAIFVLGTILAAAVPTVILFSPDFGATLRNIYSTKIGGIGLRKAMIVVQFSVSTVLMIGIFVITNQLAYVSSKDKGFKMNDILVIKTPHAKDTTWNVKRKTLETFKERCAALPFVTDITSSTMVPGEEYRHETYLSLKSTNDKSLVHQYGVDDNFFGLYEVEFIAGQNFIRDARAKNRNSIILNESAARSLGISDFDKIINAKIVDHEEEPNLVYDLVGIVKDFHQTSLKNEMQPMAFKYNVVRGHSSIKINSAGLNDTKLAEALESLKQIWRQTYPDASFDYFFLDEKYEAQNMEDRYFGKLFEYFTVLSIIISCLGLFGLSLLISTKRQKEVGVRKVFGASSSNILAIFLKGYLGPLCVSMAIGCPLAYFLMNMWLRNYAYRIEIGFELVSLALLSLTVIFVCTVSYHTIKSSIANPVTILKD